MGLFSKKTLTCSRCGKEFEARVAMKPYLCPECREKEAAARKNVEGYINLGTSYRGEMFREYTYEDCLAIASHRDEVLSRIRLTDDGMTLDEMIDKGTNINVNSDEEADDVLQRAIRSTYFVTPCGVLNQKFIAPYGNGVSDVFVDTADVFAVALANAGDNGNSFINAQEYVQCVIFTNDPYVPVMRMFVSVKKGITDFVKSKKGREAIASYFELIWPNLQYPVQDVKALKKQIKTEGTVRGNIGTDEMKELLSDAESSSGFFKLNNVGDSLDSKTEKTIKSLGFVPGKEFNSAFGFNSALLINGRYWRKVQKRLYEKE